MSFPFKQFFPGRLQGTKLPNSETQSSFSVSRQFCPSTLFLIPQSAAGQ